MPDDESAKRHELDNDIRFNSPRTDSFQREDIELPEQADLRRVAPDRRVNRPDAIRKCRRAFRVSGYLEQTHGHVDPGRGRFAARNELHVPRDFCIDVRSIIFRHERCVLRAIAPGLQDRARRSKPKCSPGRASVFRLSERRARRVMDQRGNVRSRRYSQREKWPDPANETNTGSN